MLHLWLMMCSYFSLYKLFCSTKVINILLGMELLTFLSVLVLFFSGYEVFYNSSMLIFYLFLMVGESVLGLSLLVKLITLKCSSDVSVMIGG